MEEMKAVRVALFKRLEEFEVEAARVKGESAALSASLDFAGASLVEAHSRIANLEAKSTT